MNNENGIPNGGATPHGQSKARVMYAPDGSTDPGAAKGADSLGADSLPLVMVSDLPEEALPHTEKFPLWVRTLIFATGGGLSWALIYALVHRG